MEDRSETAAAGISRFLSHLKGGRHGVPGFVAIRCFVNITVDSFFIAIKNDI